LRSLRNALEESTSRGFEFKLFQGDETQEGTITDSPIWLHNSSGIAGDPGITTLKGSFPDPVHGG